MRAARRVGRTVDAAAALRRLHPRDPVAHAAAGDRAHASHPRDGARAAGGGDADDRARGLTLVGISVGNLDDDDAVQLALPFDRADGERTRLPPSIDVRDRFGSAAVTRAVLLDRDPMLSVPMLPD